MAGNLLKRNQAMKRIIDIEQAIKLSRKLRKEGKTVILAGGCFDVIHLGHIKFLEAAKKTNGILFIILESDESVRKIKGAHRPIHSQDDRARVLAGIRFVDYVIKIPELVGNDAYDKLVTRINPTTIAVTKDSTALEHSRRQAKKINAELVEVIGHIPEKSTTRIAQIILDENKL
jgi:rfaE bifunctional protein nucleotidyltransferase chain/domain